MNHVPFEKKSSDEVATGPIPFGFAVKVDFGTDVNTLKEKHPILDDLSAIRISVEKYITTCSITPCDH